VQLARLRRPIGVASAILDIEAPRERDACVGNYRTPPFLFPDMNSQQASKARRRGLAGVSVNGGYLQSSCHRLRCMTGGVATPQPCALDRLSWVRPRRTGDELPGVMHA
jgi:hypothetical protein